MDTSAVYGLFEELKQSLTEMASSLRGRSEQQTIDLSKVEELFEKMNTLSKQEVFSPEQIRVLKEILAKGSLIKELYTELKTLAKNHVNVVTICKEAFSMGFQSDIFQKN